HRVKLFSGQITQLDGGFTQADLLLVSVLCNLGSFVVTDVRIQRGHEHQGVFQMLVDLSAVELDSIDTKFDETVRRVVQQSNRVQEVVNHHRLVDVQLEIALRSTKTRRQVVTKDLHRDHRQRLALRWVHFARHD